MGEMEKYLFFLQNEGLQLNLKIHRDLTFPWVFLMYQIERQLLYRLYSITANIKRIKPQSLVHYSLETA